MSKDGSLIDRPHIKPPEEETEPPIDFASLDLWEFSKNDEAVKRSEAGFSSYNKTGVIMISGEVFKFNLKYNGFINQLEQNNLVYKQENFEFCLSKDNTKILTSFINFKKNKKTDESTEATLYVKRYTGSQCDDSTKGKGIEFYKKMLSFLQNYSNENAISVHHVVRELSDMSDTDWHAKFDPILIDKKYIEIPDNPPDKWEKMYNPTPAK